MSHGICDHLPHTVHWQFVHVLPIHSLYPHSTIDLLQYILEGCLHLILDGAFKLTPIYKICPVFTFENGALDDRLEPCLPGEQGIGIGRNQCSIFFSQNAPRNQYILCHVLDFQLLAFGQGIANRCGLHFSAETFSILRCYCQAFANFAVIATVLAFQNQLFQHVIIHRPCGSSRPDIRTTDHAFGLDIIWPHLAGEDLHHDDGLILHGLQGYIRKDGRFTAVRNCIGNSINRLEEAVRIHAHHFQRLILHAKNDFAATAIGISHNCLHVFCAIFGNSDFIFHIYGLARKQRILFHCHPSKRFLIGITLNLCQYRVFYATLGLTIVTTNELHDFNHVLGCNYDKYLHL